MTLIDTPRAQPPAEASAAGEERTVSTVVYTADDGTVTEIEGRPGDSIMETAVRNGIPGIVGECGGSLSCATCHVFASPETWELVGPPGDLEDEMLDGTATDREDCSRLSCQIKLVAGETYRVTTPRDQL